MHSEFYNFFEKDSIASLKEILKLGHSIGIHFDSTFWNLKDEFQLVRNLTFEKAILNRDKQGFSAPDESWYRGENANYIKEILLSEETISTNYINRDYLTKIIDQHMDENKNHRLLIWSFLNFEWWCRIFLK